MAIFTLTNKQKHSFDRFTSDIGLIIDTLTKYGDKKDIDELIRFQTQFSRKIKDFFNKERWLNIGIVGQVRQESRLF